MGEGCVIGMEFAVPDKLSPWKLLMRKSTSMGNGFSLKCVTEANQPANLRDVCWGIKKLHATWLYGLNHARKHPREMVSWGNVNVLNLIYVKWEKDLPEVNLKVIDFFAALHLSSHSIFLHFLTYRGKAPFSSSLTRRVTFHEREMFKLVAILKHKYWFFCIGKWQLL